MTDEPLPATDGAETEPNSTDETDRGEADRDETDRGEADPSRDPATPDRGSGEGPDRATDPPPDGTGGDEACECGRGTGDEDGECGEVDDREYRLERLRLWRTVVTLAVVVARLVRSL